MFSFLAVKPILMKIAKFTIILYWIIPFQAAIAQVATPIAEFESIILCGSAAIPNAINGFVQNPAAASFSNSSGYSLFQQSYPSLPNLSLNSISFKHGGKFKKGYSLTQFGTPFYRIFSAQLALASKLNENFAIGVLLGLNTFPTEELSTRVEPSIGFGFCWKPYKNWSFGLTYQQPIHALQQISIAATWAASNNLEWSFSIQKRGVYSQSFKSGLRYRIKDEFYLLSGFGVSPVTSAFGILLPIKKLNLGLGSQLQELAGWQACFTLHYLIE